MQSKPGSAAQLCSKSETLLKNVVSSTYHVLMQLRETLEGKFEGSQASEKEA